MKVTRKSMLTGVERTREINTSVAQMELWKGGRLIQQAMPQLSADDREFVKTGITASEWAAAFPPELDEDPPTC